MRLYSFLCFVALVLRYSMLSAQPMSTASGSPLDSLLKAHPDKFATVLAHEKKHRLQIIYTQINRDAKNVPHFTTYEYRVNPHEYFYPASTVKFPITLLALEKIDRLGIKNVTKYTPMFTDSARPPQHTHYRESNTRNGFPSVADYAKQILLVSDNEAYNRLYEFVGRKTIHTMLAEKGFSQLKIVKRLSSGTSYQEDYCTNPVRFVQEPTSQQEEPRTLYSQAETCDTTRYEFPLLEGLKQGKGVMRSGKIVPEPIDFGNSNYFPLRTFHDMMQNFIFPSVQKPEQRFKLSSDDRAFVLKAMGMFPRESDYPKYDSSYYDGYCKFFVYGDTKAQQNGTVRIFNKVGDAYGYLIDCAYIIDFTTKAEFMIAATLHVNDDEIFNDDKYEYETIGFPFLANLGRVVLQYEQSRPRTFKPDLSEFEKLFPQAKQ